MAALTPQMSTFTPSANIASPGAFASPTQCRCYAAITPGAPLVPHTITRRSLGPADVAIQIKFAGICHSDIHQARDEWGKGTFPMVPGHEIGGVVVAIGSNVTKFKEGEHVGVGCMVDSCRKCEYCKSGEEQFCTSGAVFTYNSHHKFDHCSEGAEKVLAQGGYSESILVDEAFVCGIPMNLDLAAATPLMCAGITTFSPLLYYGLKPNQKLAVMGLGGLGHMGVKFGVAMGAHVTVISRGNAKKEESMNKLGAHDYLDSTDAVAFKAAASSFDFILDTVSADHDIMAYMNLLRVNGTFCIVGIPVEPFMVKAGAMISKRKRLVGSLIGGIQETQDMLDFCGRHNITCDVEMVKAQDINECYERAMKSDVKYRFVIDTASLQES